MSARCSSGMFLAVFRKDMVRWEVKRERNAAKSLKRMLQRTNPTFVKVSAEEPERNALLRRSAKILVELKNKGLYPKSPRLLPVRRRHISETGVRNDIQPPWQPLVK